MIRLNKYLSEAGICSRREADRLIEACLLYTSWSLTKDYDSMKLQFRELRMEACVLKRELKIGIPGALQACAYGVTNVVIQASINSFGTDIAAGWAAYGKRCV